MAARRAALGFKLHTGWAAVVAVSGAPGNLEVLLRRRVELLPADGSIPRFVFHEAAELEAGAAVALVKRAAGGAQQAARLALKEVLEELLAKKVAVKTAGIATGSTAVPADLARILAAHPLIHAAEGKLFQDAVSGSCHDRGLAVAAAPERELLARAAGAYRMDAARFRQALDAVRQSVGAPWGADQKTAAAAGLLALQSTAAPRAGVRAPSRG